MKRQILLCLVVLTFGVTGTHAQTPSPGHATIDKLQMLTSAIKCPDKGNNDMAQMCQLTRNSLLLHIDAFCESRDCENATPAMMNGWLAEKGPVGTLDDDKAVASRNQNAYVDGLTGQLSFHCSWHTMYKAMGSDAEITAISDGHRSMAKHAHLLLSKTAPKTVASITQNVCPNFAAM